MIKTHSGDEVEAILFLFSLSCIINRSVLNEFWHQDAQSNFQFGDYACDTCDSNMCYPRFFPVSQIFAKFYNTFQEVLTITTFE